MAEVSDGTINRPKISHSIIDYYTASFASMQLPHQLTHCEARPPVSVLLLEEIAVRPVVQYGVKFGVRHPVVVKVGTEVFLWELTVIQPYDCLLYTSPSPRD